MPPFNFKLKFWKPLQQRRRARTTSLLHPPAVACAPAVTGSVGEVSSNANTDVGTAPSQRTPVLLGEVQERADGRITTPTPPMGVSDIFRGVTQPNVDEMSAAGEPIVERRHLPIPTVERRHFLIPIGRRRLPVPTPNDTSNLQLPRAPSPEVQLRRRTQVHDNSNDDRVADIRNRQPVREGNDSEAIVSTLHSLESNKSVGSIIIFISTCNWSKGQMAAFMCGTGSQESPESHCWHRPVPPLLFFFRQSLKPNTKLESQSEIGW